MKTILLSAGVVGFVAVFGCAPSRNAATLKLTADSTQSNRQTHTTTLRGHVSIESGAFLITADEVVTHDDTPGIDLAGHVRMQPAKEGRPTR
jgi:lipopolysaccharide export system protein LptA